MILLQKIKNTFLNVVYTKKVAVVAFSSGGISQQTQAGFLFWLNSQKYLNSRIYSSFILGHESEEELRQKVREDFQKNTYDVIFSIGTTATLVLKEWSLTTANVKTPIIFVGVFDFLKPKLLNDSVGMRRLMTGTVAKPRDYQEQIEQLLFLKNDFKKAAVVYNSEDLFYQGIQDALATFQKHSIEAVQASFADAHDIKQNVTKKLRGVDLVLLLRDSVILNEIENLVRFCNENKVLLYASDVMSVVSGAALGYADYDHLIGEEAATRAHKVLLNKRHPYEMPVSIIPWKNKFFVNPYALSCQASQLDLAKAKTSVIIL